MKTESPVKTSYTRDIVVQSVRKWQSIPEVRMTYGLYLAANNDDKYSVHKSPVP